MKPSKQDFESAVAQMTILRYFPADPIQRAMVMDLLARIVGTREQLSWLVRTLVDRVGEWRGPSELRGIFCNRFKPADGIEADCSIPKFTPADNEARPALEAAPQCYLPSPNDDKISEEERRQINLLAKRMRLKST